MQDPRASIPDTVLTAPDGSRWLVRSRQLLIGAMRKQTPTVIVDGELLPIASIDADGNANVLPGVGTVQAFPYQLADLPEDLGAAIAAWLAEQAAVNGAKMLAKLYPPQERQP